MNIQPIGENWYQLYDSGSSIEYNTGPNPTAELHTDRKPQAQIFRHIDGGKVVVSMPGREQVDFYYNKSSYETAFELAKKFVIDEIKNQQIDIFR